MGAKEARNYTPLTREKLYGLSGNKCYAPSCLALILITEKKINNGVISHIEAASPEGPRYNPAMDDNERRHFDNLILLCSKCAKIIDSKESEKDYPVSLLREWKRNHEGKQMEEIANNVSLLNIVINAIAEIDIEEGNDLAVTTPFDIDSKIEFNKIKRNKSLIDSYYIYYSKLNNIYDELEAQGSFKKESLLRNVHRIYLKTRGEYVQDKNGDEALRLVQENADNIIEEVQEALFEEVAKTNKLVLETASFGIAVIMVDAFMRCKILEQPPKK